MLCGLFIGLQAFAQIERVEPPNWWTGFDQDSLQLMLYGRNVGAAEVSSNYQGVQVLGTEKADSPNYLFVNLVITQAAKPGSMKLNFKFEDGSSQIIDYELKTKKESQDSFFIILMTGIYLPIQNELKIFPSKSSEVNSPVISFKNCCVRRNSSARISPAICISNCSLPVFK